MKRSLTPIIFLLASSLGFIGCHDDPSLIGVWSGESSGCTQSEADGQRVTLSISNAPSGAPDANVFVLSALGKSARENAQSCQSSPTIIDGYTDQTSFTFTERCDEVEFTYDVDVTLQDDDVLKGSIKHPAGACQVSFTKEETP